MKVRGAAKAAVLSGDTLTKHVEPAATQAARAAAEYGSRTFVTAANLITDAVDADNHDFLELPNAKSARKDIVASVKISVYMKTPPNLGAGQPVVKTVDDAAKNCEIGVIKDGTDAIKVTHFKVVA